MPVRLSADSQRMPRLLISLLVAAVCLLALTFAAPAVAADGVPAAAQPDELLFTQTAARGTLEPTKCKCDGRYILTLRNVEKHTVWFSDRPNRHAGHLGTRAFTRAWSSFGFDSVAPDAALSAIDASGRRDTDIVELTHPTYDAKRRTMRYVVRNVPFTSGPSKVKRGADGFIPGRLRDVSLFIDDAKAPVIDGCLLVRYTLCLYWRGPDLSYANLPGIDLTGARILTAANLRGANLSGANLTGATLTGADLTGANLTNADLTATNLTDAKTFFIPTSVKGAKFCRTIMPNGSVNNSGC